MGKRSSGTFKRRAQDAYDTPVEAVIPLLPWLPDKETGFWEPCAGKGDLVHGIMSNAPQMNCVAKSDIEPRSPHIKKQDALHAVANCDMIITNPPWTRKLLHPMIDHFARLAPTWLLFDADWMHTVQAEPYLPFCRRIVSVGRVSWMENGISGKDNCAWYLFDRTGPLTETIFNGRTKR